MIFNKSLQTILQRLIGASFGLLVAGTAAPAQMPGKFPPVEVMTENCEKGRAHDCAALGAFYKDGTNGVAKDTAKAVKLLEKGCKGKNAGGCRVLGALYLNGGDGIAKDVVRANQAYTNACDFGSGMTCAYLGLGHLDGSYGQKKDVAKGLALLDKGCYAQYGSSSACMMIAHAYDNGQYGVRDADKAGRYKIQRFKNLVLECGGGIEESCVEYKKLLADFRAKQKEGKTE